VRALARDPVAETVRRLKLGEIVAIKGLGGFHLACDASQPDSVARLRARQRRPHKPLALMCANLPSVARWAQLSAARGGEVQNDRSCCLASRPILIPFCLEWLRGWMRSA
jgi:hydrogenase maturation protein HypF